MRCLVNEAETKIALDPVQAKEVAELIELLVIERPADIVEALNDQSREVAADVLLGLPRELTVEVLDQPGLDGGPEIIALLPRDAAVDLLAGVSADRVANLCRQLKEPHRSE